MGNFFACAEEYIESPLWALDSVICCWSIKFAIAQPPISFHPAWIRFLIKTYNNIHIIAYKNIMRLKEVKYNLP